MSYPNHTNASFVSQVGHMRLREELNLQGRFLHLGVETVQRGTK